MQIDIEALSKLVATHGLIGLFVGIFLSNLVPITGLSFTLATTFFILLTSTNSISPLTLTLALLTIAGAATTAKIIIFSTSKGVTQRFSLVRKRRKELARIIRGKEHIVMLITIVVAMTPLPDDAWYIPLGAIGFNTIRFALSVFIGKLLQATIALLLGLTVGSSITSFFTGSPETITFTRAIAGMIVTLSLALAITYIGLKVDWMRFVTVSAKRGFKEALIDALTQITNDKK